MAISKSVAWLREQLETRRERLLVMDCRARELYDSSHVEAAINVAIPSLMLRRLKKGNLPVKSLLSDGQDRERFARRCRTDTIVLYDECSREWNENVDGGSVLGLLLRRMKDEGYKAFYLEGGFSKFQAECPALCETNLDGSCGGSGSPTSHVLGLGGLRISSDSSDIESDADREPGSATDSDGSPASNPQPSFPVEILPHLYLGCAKDSTNLDVLEEFGIKYILNVTPNLPNLFENAGEFKYKQIPISDHWSQNLSQFFPEAISFIDEARGQKCGVLVHCLAGISRSVTVTVAYLMQKLNLSMNDAYDIVKMKKSNISPNFNFMGQLLDFERTLGLQSPCDNRASAPSQPLYFSTPTNHNVFQLDPLESTRRRVFRTFLTQLAQDANCRELANDAPTRFGPKRKGSCCTIGTEKRSSVSLSDSPESTFRAFITRLSISSQRDSRLTHPAVPHFAAPLLSQRSEQMMDFLKEPAKARCLVELNCRRVHITSLIFLHNDLNIPEIPVFQEKRESPRDQIRPCLCSVSV
ncbi:hypothetical protein KOW79_007706, partial [Hemibagrus wyckioides]